jgi:hypothetical protein
MKKVVYWKISQRGAGWYIVRFWQKPDKSDALQERMVTIAEKNLRTMIENTTGLKNFDLKQERD